MDNLNLSQTASTPAILADWDKGLIQMTGDSYPENSFELFQPLIDWVEAYLANAGQPLHLELSLVYLNTSSIRSMMDIFDQLEVAHNKGMVVSARWTYDVVNERVGRWRKSFAKTAAFPSRSIANLDEFQRQHVTGVPHRSFAGRFSGNACRFAGRTGSTL